MEIQFAFRGSGFYPFMMARIGLSVSPFAVASRRLCAVPDIKPRAWATLRGTAQMPVHEAFVYRFRLSPQGGEWRFFILLCFCAAKLLRSGPELLRLARLVKTAAFGSLDAVRAAAGYGPVPQELYRVRFDGVLKSSKALHCKPFEL